MVRWMINVWIENMLSVVESKYRQKKQNIATVWWPRENGKDYLDK